MKVPVVAVLGNHDFESGKPRASPQDPHRRRRVAARRRCVEIARRRLRRGQGLRRRLRRARAPAVGRSGRSSAFVHEAVDEALKLESALARLRTPGRVALLHYAPIAARSRASRPRSFRSSARAGSRSRSTATPSTAVFHGHAHHGPLEGRTRRRRAGLQRGAAAAPADRVSRPLRPSGWSRFP